MALKVAIAELAREQKEREVLVKRVQGEYKIGEKDNVDEKGVITRAAAKPAEKPVVKPVEKPAVKPVPKK